MRQVLFALLTLTAVPAFAAPAAVKHCVALNRVDRIQPVDDRTIYYRENQTWFRNDLEAACPGLDKTKSVSSRTPTQSLCAGDPVTVFRASDHVEFATCPLGEFTRADPPRR